jgi:energy-coupling factor transporter ATP-binding protein EcfA2
MISQLKIKNFTVFKEANLAFADGVNVIIGSNGAGKSHLLKLAYSVAKWSQEMALKERGGTRPDKATLQKELGGKLVRVFRPDTLGRLNRRGRGVQKKTEVEAGFRHQPRAGFRFSFSTKSATDVILEKVPEDFFADETVFFPTKEMLSMFPGFTGLYRDREMSIDETYYDLCLALEKPLLRGRRWDEINSLLMPVEKILGGSIRIENGRFYLVQEGAGKFEIPLVAEGFRKLGAVAYLLGNGTLAKQSILFWDEPETNLNPAYMAKVARLLVDIARNGTQVFAATHSLFILRELSMLLGQPENADVARSFTALENTEAGAVARTGASAEEIEPITALDAEIEQSQRYMELHH